MDIDPRAGADICEDVMAWDFRKYPRGSFELIVASPPCTEYSRAKTIGARDLEGADALVQRTLQIIQYLAPRKWWLENPRYGLLPKREFMRGIPYVDVDYCQFSGWGFMKPTRFWGSAHVRELAPVLCNPETCPNIVQGKRHWRPLNGPIGGSKKALTYPIPEGVVEYVSGLCPLEEVRLQQVGVANLAETPPGDLGVRSKRVRFQIEEGEGLDPEEEIAQQMQKQFREKPCETRDAETHPTAEQARDGLLKEFSETSLSGKYIPDPPVRGPFGEAEIWIQEGARPVGRPMFHMKGDRQEAHSKLIQAVLDAGKMEPGSAVGTRHRSQSPRRNPENFDWCRISDR